MFYRLQRILKVGRCAIKEQRLHKRYEAEKACLLERDNDYLPATIRNISFGGALLHNYKLLKNLHVGDTCTVNINGELPYEYPCKIIRVNTADIALEFTDRHNISAVGYRPNSH